MKPIFVVCVVLLTCGYTKSYPVYGTKRYHRTSPAAAAAASAPVPIYSSAPQYFDDSNTNYPPYVYPSYPQQQPVQRISDYYYSPRQDYQYYGMPTYRGEYSRPSNYYYAYPINSYSDDRVESNPLDDLHEEILQEHERERSRDYMPITQENWYDMRQQSPDNNDYNTNAEFMRNLVMYNKQLDRMHNSQNLQNLNDYGDYEEDNGEWYDTTSINLNAYKNNGNQQKSQTYQQSPQTNNPSYDEEVNELKKLKTHHTDTPSFEPQNSNKFETPSISNQYDNPSTNQIQYDQQYFGQPKNWQQDLQGYNSFENSFEPEYDDSDWINWENKRDIQPKKDIGIFGLSESNRKPPETKPETKKPETSTPKVEKLSNELPTKSHKGQKEVVLPRPATPVRKPFTEPIMKLMNAKQAKEIKVKKSSGPQIYDTIKQIIDMEQNLNHLTDNQLPTSKIQKRFVTNEEALVQQLNGLKRTSK